MPKEMKIDDITVANNDRLTVVVHDDGSCTMTLGLLHHPKSRNPDASRCIGLTKEKVLALAKFIVESEENLPIAKGVAQ